MRNPINKRLRRELIKEWKRYIVLFLLMTFMIASASGIFVANGSMMAAIDESYEKYNIEDGHFELKDEATPELLASFPDSITVYELFSKEMREGEDAVARVFRIREDVNRASVNEGRLPEHDGEIAIDRMHADVIDAKIGDSLTVGGRNYTIVGLIALSDYSSLFKNNSDIMFNSVNFNVALMTDSDWEALDANVIYTYAYTFNEEPADLAGNKEISDNLMEQIAVLAATGGYTDDKEEAEALMNDMTAMAVLAEYADDMNELLDFVPEYANQAIHFAPDDLGSDSAIMGVLVYVFIAVLAFIFAITTSNTIENESAVIGTLRAAGYTRSELTRHYMLVPGAVTLLSAAAGNILGYTVFKDTVVSMYYNSYSFVTYETLWNPGAFINTTVVPLVLVFIINLVMITRYLKLSPLRFLRHDLSTSKKKKAVRLPRVSFLNRFRIRIFLQNLGGYIVLFFGIGFVMLLLAFAVILPETLDIYKTDMTENMIADYQYLLKDCRDDDGNCIETSEPCAERVSLATLVTTDGVREGEEIGVYGIEDDSRYIDIGTDLGEGEVMISTPYAHKFMLGEGDTVVLKEKYSDDLYTFTVRGVLDYPGSLCVFMDNDSFNTTFGYDEGSFMGFLSDEEITDIDSSMIYTVITAEDILSLSTQIDHSMGNYMDYTAAVCLILGILMIYLLTKIIIEKNAVSISMVKVLGYKDSEINSLYISLTTVITVIITAVTAFLSIIEIDYLFRLILNTMSGWFEITVTPAAVIKMIAIMLVSYFIVSFFDMMRIKKIPLSNALKNVE